MLMVRWPCSLMVSAMHAKKCSIISSWDMVRKECTTNTNSCAFRWPGDCGLPLTRSTNSANKDCTCAGGATAAE